ncbi:MAG: flavin reductase family protein [Solirubrobacterales bacterium]
MQAETDIDEVDVDPLLFRRTLANLPTGVVLVAARVEGGEVGLVCNSFTSVSLEPPLVSFCVAHTSTTWPRIQSSGRFCVSVLADHHLEAPVFSSRSEDRFVGLDLLHRRSGPALADACAWIDCLPEDVVPAGDHLIVVARVMDLEAAEEEVRRPLVFWRGLYGSFAAAPLTEAESAREYRPE